MRACAKARVRAARARAYDTHTTNTHTDMRARIHASTHPRTPRYARTQSLIRALQPRAHSANATYASASALTDASTRGCKHARVCTDTAREYA